MKCSKRTGRTVGSGKQFNPQTELQQQIFKAIGDTSKTLKKGDVNFAYYMITIIGNCIDRDDFHEAAFELHQATERYCTTILLVFTDYRPEDRNIETLGIKAEMCDKRFAMFPKQTAEEKRLFELLKKAYIDARYKMDEYSISKAELEQLAGYVTELKAKTLQFYRPISN